MKRLNGLFFYTNTMSIISCVQGIRDEIASRLNEVESDNSDRYTNYLNFGIADLFKEFPDSTVLHTSADKTISAGTRIYSLPSNYDKFNAITYPAKNRRIDYLEPQQFDYVYPSAYSGDPLHYTIRGSEVSSYMEFGPTPNASITIHEDYQKLIPTVSAGSAVPQIPTKYFNMLCDYGEASGLWKKGDRESAALVWAKYDSEKQKMINDLRAMTTEIGRIRQVREFQADTKASNDPIVNTFNTL